MGLGDRRDGPLGGGPGGQVGDRRFKMRQNMVSIGDDFWIENGVGRKAYKIDGKAITLRNTLVMETPQGAALLQMQGKAVSVRQAMDIERPGGKGEPFCTIKKDLVNVVRDEYEVKMRGGKPDLEVRGNILDHEYTIVGPGRKQIAEVTKKWIALVDHYTIEISPGVDYDEHLIIAIAVAVDQLSHDQRGAAEEGQSAAVHTNTPASAPVAVNPVAVAAVAAPGGPPPVATAAVVAAATPGGPPPVATAAVVAAAAQPGGIEHPVATAAVVSNIANPGPGGPGIDHPVAVAAAVAGPGGPPPVATAAVVAAATPGGPSPLATAAVVSAVAQPGPAPVAAPAPQLPPGWIAQVDAASGKTFYVNTTVNPPVTQWNPPTVGAPPAAAPPPQQKDGMGVVGKAAVVAAVTPGQNNHLAGAAAVTAATGSAAAGVATAVMAERRDGPLDNRRGPGRR